MESWGKNSSEFENSISGWMGSWQLGTGTVTGTGTASQARSKQAPLAAGTANSCLDKRQEAGAMKCPPLTCCCCFYLLSMSELSLNIHTLHGLEFLASHFIQRRNAAKEGSMERNVVVGEMIDPISSRPFPFCSFHLNLDRQRRLHCATRQ